MCTDVDVAQSVKGDPCLWSCSMLSVDIDVFVTVVSHLCGKIEKNEMGGACGAYGGGWRCAQDSSGET